jgi:transposase
MQYVGIDWAYRRAAWCAKQADGTIAAEGFVAADEDGLARLVIELGPEVRACLEMMSGAVWVRDQLAGAGWRVEVADARKVKNVAPLACKTDRVDARMLAELCRRELVPALWIPSLEERALRERLKRRLHPVRLRTSAKNRVFGLLIQWGLRIRLDRLRRPDAMELLETRGVPAVWRRSVAEALALIELLDERIAPLDRELGPLARADRKGRPTGASLALDSARPLVAESESAGCDLGRPPDTGYDGRLECPVLLRGVARRLHRRGR